MKKARQKQARQELTRCFFHKNHMLFIAALAVGIAINCSNLLFSYLIQRITDVAMGHDITPLWRLLMITAVGIAAFFALEWLWSVVKPRFVTRAVRQYKSHVFTRLMQKSIASFQREGSAEYNSALTNDIAMIERDYLPQLTSIASLAAVFFGSLAMMLYYSPLLTVAGVALSLLPMAVSVVTAAAWLYAKPRFRSETPDLWAWSRICSAVFRCSRVFAPKARLSGSSIRKMPRWKKASARVARRRSASICWARAQASWRRWACSSWARTWLSPGRALPPAL